MKNLDLAGNRKRENCELLELSRRRACRIAYCADCGVVHVELGYAALKLDRDCYTALCEVMTEALARLRRQEPPANPAGTDDAMH